MLLPGFVNSLSIHVDWMYSKCENSASCVCHLMYDFHTVSTTSFNNYDSGGDRSILGWQSRGLSQSSEQQLWQMVWTKGTAGINTERELPPLSLKHSCAHIIILCILDWDIEMYMMFIQIQTNKQTNRINSS